MTRTDTVLVTMKFTFYWMRLMCRKKKNNTAKDVGAQGAIIRE